MDSLRKHGFDATRGSLSRATGMFVASFAAVTLAVAASAAIAYLVLASLTSASIVPRSRGDWHVLVALLLAIGAFAVMMATRDELRARRRI